MITNISHQPNINAEDLIIFESLSIKAPSCSQQEAVFDNMIFNLLES